MIPRLLEVAPMSKILVVLRDPVARAYSQYQMSIDTSGTEEQQKIRGISSYSSLTFEEVVEREISELAEIGIKVICFSVPSNVLIFLF